MIGSRKGGGGGMKNDPIYTETASQKLEKIILDRYGMLPTSDPPNPDPKFQSKLLKLARWMNEKEISCADVLFASALELCSRDETPQTIGLAQIFFTAGSNLYVMEDSAEEVGASRVENSSVI